MSFAQFRRYALTLLLLTAAVGLDTGRALAQGAAGKLQGRVVDAAGQPVVAAQVYVEGTSLGNITNAQGDYFINEVPAGLHRVSAQRIGYRTFTWSDQRVLAGRSEERRVGKEGRTRRAL